MLGIASWFGCLLPRPVYMWLLVLRCHLFIRCTSAPIGRWRFAGTGKRLLLVSNVGCEKVSNLLKHLLPVWRFHNSWTTFWRFLWRFLWMCQFFSLQCFQPVQLSQERVPGLMVLTPVQVLPSASSSIFPAGAPWQSKASITLGHLSCGPQGMRSLLLLSVSRCWVGKAADFCSLLRSLLGSTPAGCFAVAWGPAPHCSALLPVLAPESLPCSAVRRGGRECCQPSALPQWWRGTREIRCFLAWLNVTVGKESPWLKDGPLCLCACCLFCYQSSQLLIIMGALWVFRASALFFFF